MTEFNAQRPEDLRLRPTNEDSKRVLGDTGTGRAREPMGQFSDEPMGHPLNPLASSFLDSIYKSLPLTGRAILALFHQHEGELASLSIQSAGKHLAKLHFISSCSPWEPTPQQRGISRLFDHIRHYIRVNREASTYAKKHRELFCEAISDLAAARLISYTISDFDLYAELSSKLPKRAIYQWGVTELGKRALEPKQ